MVGNQGAQLQRIRLLYLVNEFSDDSSNQLILSVADGLDRERYRIFVGCLHPRGGPMVDMFESAKVSTINFGMRGKLGIQAILHIKEFIVSRKIQIVHTHVLRSDLLGGIATRMARDPVLVSTKHNMGYVRGQNGWLIRNLFYWPAMYMPDKVVTVTDVLRRQLRLRMHLGSDRVSTIHPAIDIAEYYHPEEREGLRGAMNLSTSDYLVTFAGRLVAGKGLDILLESARKVLALHPSAYFLVVGRGPQRASYEAYARELGISNRVVFTGFRSDIPTILAGTDVFVLPSISEGMPKSLLEAMAARKAVVASSVGGVAELIKSPDVGLLVAHSDPSALADAISDLISNQSRRNKIGSRAQQYVKSNFSVDHMVSSYDALYEESLGSKVANSMSRADLIADIERVD